MAETKTPKLFRRAAFIATVTLLAGVTTSLAGNIQAINLDNHHPGVGATISATLWPVFLFFSVEIMLHTPWLANWRDHMTKAVTLVLVSAVAAYVSYFHLAHVLSSYGYDVVSRYAGPLAIDSAMVMAALALNRVGRARRGELDTPAPVAPPATVPAKPSRAATAQDVAESEAAFRGEGVDMDALMAKAGEAMAADAEHYLDRLAKGLDTTSTPAVPVVTGEDKPLPRRRGKVADNQELAALIQAGQDNELKTKDVDTLLANYYDVSDRTIRRIRAAINGQPVSGVPAQDGQSQDS